MATGTGEGCWKLIIQSQRSLIQKFINVKVQYIQEVQ
jgi:hypothetical protein